ncbi:thymic stromal cotransporter homolog [Oncorhynchus tshawytscha]|uniref:Solute carrier family 46 member 2 n=1 Tax=Oncorhynchus tshawytscha TaxID=74940 RepID=A0A8C8J4G7_ONCTS|nr:thymic stromal cotransporter homolog [Oncorhynchus tshawytscha]
MLSFGKMRKRIEPVVLCAQIASAFFDTGLQMVVKERCANMTDALSPTPTEDSRQKAMSNFYMIYNMLAKFVPILPAILLAKVGDLGYRKIPIVIPLVGYLVSRVVLLLVIVMDLPIQAMFGGVVVHGLSGGFCSYWAGVMALVSLTSTEEDRSLHMMHIELVYGVAGLVGSLASGHLFQLYSVDFKQGTLLVSLSVFLYFLCLIYTTFFFLMPSVSTSAQERNETNGFFTERNSRNILNILLLFASGILYDVAVGGGMEILVTFEMKEPLNWSATQVGYGNAAGFVVFLTSFLGVMVMSRWVSDVTLIIIGMVSFAAGIYFMAFVTATYMFYLARALTLFALIPMPTIRALLSKQVNGSSYGITLISLQLSFKIASLAYTPIYTKVYQATLDWFPGSSSPCPALSPSWPPYLSAWWAADLAGLTVTRGSWGTDG